MTGIDHECAKTHWTLFLDDGTGLRFKITGLRTIVLLFIGRFKGRSAIALWIFTSMFVLGTHDVSFQGYKKGATIAPLHLKGEENYSVSPICLAHCSTIFFAPCSFGFAVPVLREAGDFV